MPIAVHPSASAVCLFACCGLLLASLPGQSTPRVPDDPLAAMRAMPAQPAVDGGLVVTVVSADGEPLPDAVVVLAPSSGRAAAAMRAASEQKFPGDEVRIFAARATAGARHAVDDRGRTRLPRGRRGRIVALHGDTVASVLLRPGGRQRPVELKMEPCWSVSATVRTAAGLPAANVTVGVCSARNRPAFPRARTDDAGQATFRLVPGRDAESALVRAVITAREAPTAKLPMADGGAVTIDLPPCGSVVARLTETLPPGSTCTWRMRTEDGSSSRGVPDPRDAAQATFPFVEAGVVGRIRCEIDGSRYRKAEFAAVVAGKQQSVELGRPEAATLVLRVVSPTGAPMPNCKVRHELDYPQGGLSARGRTNPNGWLMVDVPKSALEGASLALEVARGEGSGALVGTAKLELGKVEQPRDDRGDVPLKPAVLALAGKLVDHKGRPVAGVTLEARADDPYRGYRATTAGDGSFALNTPTKSGTVELSLTTDDWFFLDQPTQRAAYDFGSEGLQIELCPAARVKLGAVGLDPFERADVEVHCESADDPSLQLDIAFPWRGDHFKMPAGEWDVVFSSGDEEFHRIPKVIAESGIEVHDPRFMFFDWQKFMTLVKIEVQDGQGRPLDHCTVWVHHGPRGRGSGTSNGVYRVLIPKAGARISVELEGLGRGGRIELGSVTADQIVRVGAGPRLMVTLDAAPALPAGVRLLAGVGDVWQAFDAEGRAALWLPKVGRYRVHLAVERGGRRVVVDRDFPAVDVPVGGATLAMQLDDGLRERVQKAVRQRE